MDSLSGGQLAYVYVPNTSSRGFEYFNRYYFAQQDKKGVIVDELTGLGVLSVTHGLLDKGSHHLGVAVVATLPQVDIAAVEFQRRIRFYRSDSGDIRLNQKRRNDLEQRGRDDGHSGHHGKKER